MKKAFTMHMRTKILLLCITCTLLALSLQTLFFQRSASSIVYEQEKSISRNSLQNMQDELYGQIKSYENNLIKIYDQTDFIRDLAVPLPIGELEKRYNRIAYNMALTIFSPSQSIGAIYIYDVKHRLISSYRSANTPRYNYPIDIFQDAQRNNSAIVKQYGQSGDRVMLVSSYFNAGREKDLIRFVLKIYSNNVTNKIGYIVCDADTANFIRIIKKYTYSPKQFVWLQPEGDRPVLRSGSLNDPLGSFFFQTVKETRESLLPGEESRVIKGSVFLNLPQEKYNLISFSLTPQYLLEESQLVLRQNMFIIALMVVLVALVAATLTSQSLTTPLRRIAGSLEEIKSGKTYLRLEQLKKDEIGELGQTINEMLDRIQGLVAQEYHLEMLLKQAEYRALQAQVNPHFLYNSLDTMSGVAASQNCHTVSFLCNALSNMFRYSIAMSDPMATIDSEIIHIKNYMFVMNTRMQNSVELDIRLEQEMMPVKIPRLSLQPIVENAVNHGLKNKRGNKKIFIEGAMEGEDILLSVRDNGVGMDEEQVNRRLKMDSEETLELRSSIGLANINSRIRILFGDRYGIRVSSKGEEGSTVSIRIPREMKGPDTL